MPFIPDREKVSPVDFFNFGDTKMTTNTSAALEKAGKTNPLLKYAHSVPMSKVFQNIFLPPAQGSRRVQMPDTFTVPILNCNDTKYVPAVHEGYCFRKDLLRSVLAFLMYPHGDALFLTGPTGSGKTSLITEIFGRLNWPLQQFTMTERFEFADLRGSWIYSRSEGSDKPEMTFQPGPLLTAMKEGHGILLNEVDIAPAGELSGLNDIIEGRPLIVPETNEVIHPHPLFRVIVTGNSKGAGDDTGAYVGVQQQNIAAMDRYRILEVGYPAKEVEEGILTSIFAPTLGVEAKNFAKKFVDLANRVRAQFVGLNPLEGTIAVPMSTRCLTRWAYLMQDFCGCSNAVRAALNESLLNRCTESDRDAINAMALAVFGETWTNAID